MGLGLKGAACYKAEIVPLDSGCYGGSRGLVVRESDL